MDGQFSFNLFVTLQGLSLLSRAWVTCYAFFNLLMSPNEHPNVGWVNLASTTEKMYVRKYAH